MLSAVRYRMEQQRNAFLKILTISTSPYSKFRLQLFKIDSTTHPQPPPPHTPLERNVKNVKVFFQPDYPSDGKRLVRVFDHHVRMMEMNFEG